MKSFTLKVLILLAAVSWTAKAQIYVSPTGSDSNSGSFLSPFRTLVKALTLAGPDTLIYLRGGTYSRSASESISKVGAPGQYIKIWAYPGEKPLYDFSAETVAGNDDGIKLKGRYVHLKGLEFTGAAHNGINISGHYNIIENCSSHDNRNSGIQMGSSSSTAYPRGNLFLNCDSYRNFDAPIGGNADGYAIKWNIGGGNVFRGCRAFNNSDDGWDLWMADSSVEIDSCWSFRNGKNVWGSPSFNGNGNGFKLGGNNVPTPHVVKACVAFDDSGNTGRGYDENNNLAGQTLYNCTSFRNKGDNYHFQNTVIQGQHVIENCISYQGSVAIASGTQVRNSWQGFTVTAADFLSSDTSIAVPARNPDGSLPETSFLHLAPGSSMIDTGVYVGLPYNGRGPDLGAFESPGSRTFLLTVIASGGSVSRDPDAARYDSGAAVQLTAVAGAGYHFTAWSGDASGSANPVSVTMDRDRTVTAHFALNQFTLSITATNGSVAKNPDLALYDSGSVVQLTASGDSGYHFSGWSGDASGSANPFSLAMNSNKSVSASFVTNVYSIIVSRSAHGIVTPPDSVLIPHGGSQRFLFTPDDDYYVDSVVVDGLDVPDSAAGYTFAGVTAPHSIRVTFRTDTCAFTVNARWNIVSIPVRKADSRTSVVFPLALSPAFIYTGAYTEKDTLEHGLGYWLKFDSARTVSITGIFPASDSVPVSAGWNMVGSFSKPLATGSITSDPGGISTSQFFGYDSGYSTADTLTPGHGYWVKVGSSGKLIFSSGTKSNRIRIVLVGDLPPAMPPRKGGK
jgi:uncharacterized repeat protein (TIGR02543 family)